MCLATGSGSAQGQTKARTPTRERPRVAPGAPDPSKEGHKCKDANSRRRRTTRLTHACIWCLWDESELNCAQLWRQQLETRRSGLRETRDRRAWSSGIVPPRNRIFHNFPIARSQLRPSGRARNPRAKACLVTRPPARPPALPAPPWPNRARPPASDRRLTFGSRPPVFSILDLSVAAASPIHKCPSF